MLKQIIFATFFITSTSLWGGLDISFEEEEEEITLKQIISLEVGAGSITRLKADTISGESSIKKDLTFAGIKLGAEDIGLRLFLSYRPVIIDDVFTHSFGLELDSMINITDNGGLKFFYGLIGGVVLYEIVDQNQTADYTTEASIYYGVETGLNYSFSEKFEIEIGGRFAVTNINDSSADKSYVFDQFLNYYLALNYKY
jgi:hypothetical protein